MSKTDDEREDKKSRLGGRSEKTHKTHESRDSKTTKQGRKKTQGDPFGCILKSMICESTPLMLENT